MIGLILVYAYILSMALAVVLLGWKRDSIPPWHREFWTGQKLHVAKLCSGSEDGWLWYVVNSRGERVGDGGWLHREDAEMDAWFLQHCEPQS